MFQPSIFEGVFFYRNAFWDDMILQQCCHEAVGYSPWCHGCPWVKHSAGSRGAIVAGQDDWRTQKILRKSRPHGKFPYQQSEPNGIKPISFCLEESFPGKKIKKNQLSFTCVHWMGKYTPRKKKPTKFPFQSSWVFPEMVVPPNHPF